MITFGDIRFLNQPTNTGRQLVGVDITMDGVTYDWIVYAPLLNGQDLLDYFNLISNIIELDIRKKEEDWSNHPKTEQITDPFSGDTYSVDIPKERVVHPTIPDYVEAVTQIGAEEPYLNNILNELGDTYWHYHKYAKRIIAPVDLIFDDNGIKMYGWFQINNFPVLKFGSVVNLYCNTILPEHQAIVDSFGGVLTIEDRP